MNSVLLSALGNHLWQSTFVTAVAGLLVLMLRKQGAHVRYWIWFIASMKFLVPFSLLISLGSEVRWRSMLPVPTPPSISLMATEIAQPFAASFVPRRSNLPPTGAILRHLPTTLLVIWLAGLLIILLLWVRSWLRMRAIVRRASPILLPPNIEAMLSPALLEPSVFGIFTPVLLLPLGIERSMSPDQLQAVLAHEMCHIRRRDNLLSSAHMSVAALFWFYPIVWWLGARLLDERERACDEQVVRQGSDPQAYAEGILTVCKSYLETPLRCASGVSGANLQRRIQLIISGRVAHKLSLSRVLLLAVVGIAALAARGRRSNFEIAVNGPGKPMILFQGSQEVTRVLRCSV